MAITIKQCSKCSRVATSVEEIQTLFGYRKMKPGTTPVPQAWCRTCRNPKAAPKEIPAPVLLGTGPSPDKIVAVPYKGLGQGHKPGDIVFLGTRGALYRVVGNGSITAI